MKTYSFTLYLLLMVFSGLSLSAQTNVWSNPSTWPGGVLPGVNSNVVIPAGQHIVLDISPPNLGTVTVFGKLSFADVPIDLFADWIMINAGEFEVGTQASPLSSKVSITLTGDTADVLPDMGNRFIAAMNGGIINLHGVSRDETSWSLLDQTANAGNNSIKLVQTPTWKVGDKIAISASGVDPRESEVVTVTGVSGTYVSFTPPLLYKHFGETQTIDSQLLDMRAEVILLTRNITIQGDNDPDIHKIGGHLMIMLGSKGYIEGVEFFKMGQIGRQGRYPCHWHLSGPNYDNYAKNNSVHQSFHRAFVIHQTNGVTLDYNVAYDINSHAFVVAEDGNEEDNIITNNVGMLIKKLRSTEFAFASDIIVGGSSQSEHRPGVFWMKNPNNIIRNNRAAGTVDGIGFFYDGPGTATSLPIDFFKDNISHSNYSYFSPDAFDRYPPRTHGHGIFIREDAIDGVVYDFKDFTTYKNSLSGVWLEDYNQQMTNAIVADCGTGAILMRGKLFDSKIIHQSNNLSLPTDKDYGGINTIEGHGRKKDYTVDNVTFYDFDTPIFLYEDSIMAPNIQATNIHTVSCTGPMVKFVSAANVEGALHDSDGSLSASPGSLVFHTSFPFTTPSCVLGAPSTATQVCDMDDYIFYTISSEFGAARAVGDNIKVLRSPSEIDFLYSYESPSQYTRYSFLPKDQKYGLEFEEDNLLPSLFYMDAEAEVEGYLAFRFDFNDGYLGYLIDEYDNIIAPKTSLSDLNDSETNYYVNTATGKMYVVLHVGPDNGFNERIKILRVTPSTYVLRVEAAVFNTSLSAMPSITNSFSSMHLELDADVLESKLVVYNVAGVAVKTIQTGSLTTGNYQFPLDVSNLAGGMYICRFESDAIITENRLVVFN